jgi:anti-sigma B factor antagonist
MIDEPIHVEFRDGKHEGQRIVRLTGKLTFPTPAEDERFFKQILVPPVPTVIIDLSGVSACDSSGVGELMRVHTAFKREQRRLALAATREKVQTILKIAQVFGYFNVFATVEEAEAALI